MTSLMEWAQKKIVTRERQQTPASTPKKIPETTAVGMVFQGGKVGKSNVRLFRGWAEHSEWVRAAINVRKTQVSSAEWDIVPANPDVEVDNKRLAKRIKALFDAPNATAASFRSFIEPVVEDLLVLDAGSIEKVRNLRGETVQLWGVDGGTIRVSSRWDGDPREARYFWYPDHQERARWLNEEFIYMMANPRTYTPVGLSPMETLKSTIDAELGGHEYNRRQVQAAAPDGMLDLGEGARPEQVEQFKSYWLSEVAGRGAMAFLGGTKNAKFIPFRESNKDMQFLEWQEYLVRKIAAVFGLAPQDLGITMDVNRSTSEVQSEHTEDRGLRPLLALIQDYFTREVVWDPVFGGPENNLAFRFTSLNLKETLSRAQINKIALAGSPWKTINEARKEDGREPLGPEFDELIMTTPVGAVNLEEVPSAQEALDSKKPPATPAARTGRAPSSGATPRPRRGS